MSIGRFPKFPPSTIKQKCTEQLPKAQCEKFLVLVRPQESVDGDFSDFLEEGSFSLPITDGGVQQKGKHPFQPVFEKEQFDQPAQNWKGSSTGAIPAGNTLTPGQGKGGACADRRSGISSSDTALILLTPSQNRIRTCQAQHCPFLLSSASGHWRTLNEQLYSSQGLVTARQILVPKISDPTTCAPEGRLGNKASLSPGTTAQSVWNLHLPEERGGSHFSLL